MIDDKEKQVLGLQLPTDPRWADIASMHLEDILVDNAFCEQKAASSCISLIVKFPDKKKLVETLTPIVAEEWAHFERVMEQINKRGFTLSHKRKDEYVAALGGMEKKGGSREMQLVEKLLFNALIEARSCERFRLLWKHIDDAELSKFYYELMVSEAGHYKTFLALSREYLPEKQVNDRWKEILKQEAEVMKNLTPRPDRMH